MTRTDAITRAVAEEAERRRIVLDADDPPKAVVLVVYLSRSGHPVRVTCEPRWSRDLEERR